jgi:light-regulated signal transduction histidine kinase (bacteriophytochrome)
VAAHDLQEPLKKIIAFGDLLVSECAKGINEEGKNYLDRMRNAAKRMSELISDLLKFSKVTTVQGSTDKVDLKAVIDDVLSDLELRIHETKAHVDIGSMPVIFANRVQMREVFQNLIGNAIKFRKQNEPALIRIQSRADEDGDVELTIEDNGIGFDEKYAERIFKPFERLHSRTEYDGSGIGLAICHRIISRLGGHIVAKSELGHGTTFVITFPKSILVQKEPAIATASVH